MIIDLSLTGILKGSFLHILCHQILLLSELLYDNRIVSIYRRILRLLLGTSVAVSIFTLMAGENQQEEFFKLSFSSL